MLSTKDAGERSVNYFTGFSHASFVICGNPLFLVFPEREEKMNYYNTAESGKRIKELRIKKGYTQETFADALGISATTIASIETGRKGTTIDTILLIADKLQCSLDYILLGKEQTCSVNSLLNEVPESQRVLAKNIILGILSQFSEQN